MSEEQVQEAAPVEAQSDETDALKTSVSNLEKKNSELIAELRAARNSKPKAPNDYEELVEFKRKAEQVKLESEGKYNEALQSREQQFRDAVKEKDEKIKGLEAQLKELQLITPAVSALSEYVRDTDYALNKLGKDKIKMDATGKVVVLSEDGFTETPLKEAATSMLPDWILKKEALQGGGAPIGKSSGKGIPPGSKNPFLPESYNLTEQGRLLRTNPDLYERYKSAVNG